MEKGFAHIRQGSLEYLTVPSITKAGGVIHCFTTRLGGVSEGQFYSLNFRTNCEDTSLNILKNLEIISDACGFNIRNTVNSKQIHDDKIRKVTLDDAGKGFFRHSDITNADALMTNVSGIPLFGFFADCTPILLYDPVKKAIAMVHSGWRGTVASIARKAIAAMQKEYGTNPENVIAAIGPSIGVCHFEVGQEVFDSFKKQFGKAADEFFMKKPDGKYMGDLWKANTYILKSAGITDENITVAGECTFCKSDLYYSHRATSGKRGAMAAIIQLV